MKFVDVRSLQKERKGYPVWDVKKRVYVKKWRQQLTEEKCFHVLQRISLLDSSQNRKRREDTSDFVWTAKLHFGDHIEERTSSVIRLRLEFLQCTLLLSTLSLVLVLTSRKCFSFFTPFTLGWASFFYSFALTDVSLCYRMLCVSSFPVSLCVCFLWFVWCCTLSLVLFFLFFRPQTNTQEIQSLVTRRMREEQYIALLKFFASTLLTTNLAEKRDKQKKTVKTWIHRHTKSGNVRNVSLVLRLLLGLFADMILEPKLQSHPSFRQKWP